jgi:hypothetical protein
MDASILGQQTIVQTASFLLMISRGHSINFPQKARQKGTTSFTLAQRQFAHRLRGGCAFPATIWLLTRVEGVIGQGLKLSHGCRSREWQAFFEWCERQIAERQVQLAPLVTGEMQMERRGKTLTLNDVAVQIQRFRNELQSLGKHLG